MMTVAAVSVELVVGCLHWADSVGVVDKKFEIAVVGKTGYMTVAVVVFECEELGEAIEEEWKPMTASHLYYYCQHWWIQ